MSLGYVTLSKVVPCPFPSCYIPCSEILLPYSYGRQKGKGPSSVTALRLSRGIGPTSVLFSSVAQSVRLFGTPWTSAQQASLAITNSQRLLKLISIELVMPSNHLILCHLLHLLLSIFLSIRVFPNELALRTSFRHYFRTTAEFQAWVMELICCTST